MSEAMKIRPRVLAGFRDYDPGQVRIREQMMQKIQAAFELFGFDPLDTSTVEFLEILTGRKDGWDQTGLYMLDSSLELPPDRGREDIFWERRIALRFDLTVSLARYVAANIQEIPKPFKRYQVGKVYRAEKPQEGRYREFFQFDADTMFAPDVVADAEIVAMMVETMQALDIENFVVKVNNRKIAEGLPAFLGIEPRLLDELLKVLDKRDKIGLEEVGNELFEAPERGGFGFQNSQWELLQQFIGVGGTTSERLLDAGRLFRGIEVAEQGIKELAQVMRYVKALGIPDDRWEVDFSVVRGLAYYTGPVFETVLTDLPEIGSVFSGGRFDNLVSSFSNAKVPGTGASVGVDRLLAALLKLEKIQASTTGVQCLVCWMQDEPTLALEVAAKMRDAGINTMVYSGEERSFKAQLVRAVKHDVPIALILGEAEERAGAVSVKDLRTREQVTVMREDLVEQVEQMLGA